MKKINIKKIMNKKYDKCIISLLLIVTISILQVNYSYADPGQTLRQKIGGSKEKVDVIAIDYNKLDENYYYKSKKYSDLGYENATTDKIVLKPESAKLSDSQNIILTNNEFEYGDYELWWNGKDGWVEWQFVIEEEGLYEINADYLPIVGKGTEIQRRILVDRVKPFTEAGNIPFYRKYRDAGDPIINNLGDEVSSKQIEIFEWDEVRFKDIQGMFSSPYKFYFSKGEHTIRLEYVDEPIVLGNIEIVAPTELLTYEEVKNEYDKGSYKEVNTSIKIQAEKPLSKNNISLRARYNGDPSVEPSARGNVILNTTKLWEGNSEITWQFDVPVSGLYQIAPRYRQDGRSNLHVFTQFLIDEKVPFKELEAYKFPWSKKWTAKPLMDDKGNPFLFYLEKGEHKLSVRTIMGPDVNIYNSLLKNVVELSEWNRKILTITGTNPDINFEYELDLNIPGLIEGLESISREIEEQALYIESISENSPALVSYLQVITDQLDKMVADPYIIPKNLNDLNSIQQDLSYYLTQLSRIPVMFDYFEVLPPNKIVENPQATIFEKISVTFSNFIMSFYKDYDSVSSSSEEVVEVLSRDDLKTETIDVWIARPKEYAEIMKQISDEAFTPDAGISINVNVMPAGQLAAGGVNALMLSIISGNAPDVVLGSDKNSPVELAFRDASVDLSQFENFEEVKKRFIPRIMKAFEFNEGVYGLPETMDFYIMIYRTDILNELGMSVPNTWDDVYKRTIPMLNQKGMQFYYPAIGGTSIAQVNTAFTPFLYQNGGEYYKENDTKSALDSPLALKAFKEWTKLYTIYDVDMQTDFYTRFKNSTIPIGIINFQQYMQITAAAPELFGRWDVAPIPGTIQEDGSINRSFSSPPMSCFIINQSKKQDEAWSFIEWWTSEDAQKRFGTEIEAYIGKTARWATANLNAFDQLPWDYRHLKAFIEQRDWYVEQPVVLGGYYTNRYLKNAWTSVVLENKLPRDAFDEAVEEINLELTKKQEEYDY